MTQAVTESTKRPVVSVEDLYVSFVMRDATVAAVNGVSFELAAGQVLGILGEFGLGQERDLACADAPAAARANPHQGSDLRCRA